VRQAGCFFGLIFFALFLFRSPLPGLAQEPAGQANPIDFGQTVEGELTSPDERQNWVFEGMMGQVINVELTGPQIDPYLALYGPDEQLVMTDDDSGENFNAQMHRVLLHQSGRYRIQVSSASLATGSYRLTLSEADLPRREIAYGEMVEGRVESDLGERWVFDGSQDDVVSINMSSQEIDPVLDVYGPFGELVGGDDDAGTGLNASIEALVLPHDGSYTIVARSFYGESGPYTLSMFRVEITEPGPINLGDTVTALLENSDGDVWTFEGTAGDEISLAMLGSIRNSTLDPIVKLRDPAGELLLENDDDAGNLAARIAYYQLPEDGTYSILAGTTGDVGRGEPYVLSLQPVLPEGELLYGESVSGEVTSPEGEVWKFDGRKGDVISVRMQDDELDTFLDLFSPSGEHLASDDDSGAGNNSLIGEIILPENGPYTIVARGYYGDLGTYTLTLEQTVLEITATLVVGDEVEGSIRSQFGNRYLFSAQEGQVVTIEMTSDVIDSVLELYDADNNLLARGDDSTDVFGARIENFEIPADGQYTIVARDFFGTGGTYRLSLSLGVAEEE
jgi:hypothetical protein